MSVSCSDTYVLFAYSCPCGQDSRWLGALPSCNLNAAARRLTGSLSILVVRTLWAAGKSWQEMINTFDIIQPWRLKMIACSALSVQSESLFRTNIYFEIFPSWIASIDEQPECCSLEALCICQLGSQVPFGTLHHSMIYHV